MLATILAGERIVEEGMQSDLPDVRDGLNRKERIVLNCLNEIQRERNDRNVPTAMLYGRVVEHIDISVAELQAILQRFIGIKGNDRKNR